MLTALLESWRACPLMLLSPAWCVGSHEVDGAENVYAATNKNIVVVSVDYRL